MWKIILIGLLFVACTEEGFYEEFEINSTDVFSQNESWPGKDGIAESRITNRDTEDIGLPENTGYDFGEDGKEDNAGDSEVAILGSDEMVDTDETPVTGDSTDDTECGTCDLDTETSTGSFDSESNEDSSTTEQDTNEDVNTGTNDTNTDTGTASEPDTNTEPQSICDSIAPNESIWCDPSTELMWEVGTSSSPDSWSQKYKWCDELVIGSYDDWRMANNLEMKALLTDEISPSGCFWDDEIFGTDCDSGYGYWPGGYWSNNWGSFNFENPPEQSIVTNFKTRGMPLILAEYPTVKLRVLCVRQAQ